MNKTLQQKNTYYLLIWLPLVLLTGTLLFYVLMTMHARHMAQEQLELKQRNIRSALTENPEGVARSIRGEYDINKGNSLPASLLDKQRDTAVYYQAGKEWVTFKILTKQYTGGGQTNGGPTHGGRTDGGRTDDGRTNGGRTDDGQIYQLTTYVSSKEISHLIIKVLIAEAFIFVLLLAAIVVINRKSSGILWMPFYDTLKMVKEYDIVKNKTIQLPGPTGIAEFDQLNLVVGSLIEHVNQAYSNQKQFVENASHELQTPLAIIRTKVELLSDMPELTEDTAHLLADIADANERLSQMNKNLLLLAKIDNNQFPEQNSIDLSEVTGKLLTYYEDYYDGVLPVIRKSIQPGIHLSANSSLIEILVNNLIRNSIVHNIPDGHVDIQLNHTELMIENTGHSIPGNTEQLFERFKKGREGSATTGLGLSLVREICLYYQYDLQYTYTDGLHRVWVYFGKS